MPAMTFRFSTECEMTLTGESYEAIYLRFKDFMHGDLSVQETAQLSVYPPESDQMFFHLDQEEKTYEIPFFKGGFREDIASSCEGHNLRSATIISQSVLSQRVQSFIPDFYW